MSTETSLHEWLTPEVSEIQRNKKNQSGLAALKKMMAGAPAQTARIDSTEAELRAATADLERLAKGLKPIGRDAQLKALEDTPGSTAETPAAAATETPDAAPRRRPNEPLVSDPGRTPTEAFKGIPVKRADDKSRWMNALDDETVEELVRITGAENREKFSKLRLVSAPTDREPDAWYPTHSIRIESVTIDTDPNVVRASEISGSAHWIEDDELPVPTTRVIGENERDEIRVVVAGGQESNNQGAIWSTLEKVLDRSRASSMLVIVAADTKAVFGSKPKQGAAPGGRGPAPAERPRSINPFLDEQPEAPDAGAAPRAAAAERAERAEPIGYIGQGPGHLARQWVYHKGRPGGDHRPHVRETELERANLRGADGWHIVTSGQAEGRDAGVRFYNQKNNWELKKEDGVTRASTRDIQRDRNIQMLDRGKPHLVLVFPDAARDTLTSHLAEEATHRDIPVEIGDNRGRTFQYNRIRTDEYTPPALTDPELRGMDADSLPPVAEDDFEHEPQSAADLLSGTAPPPNAGSGRRRCRRRAAR